MTLLSTRDPAPAQSSEILELIRCTSLREQAQEDLERAVVNAREVGHTWREIAQAVGMTEHGVAALHRRVTS